ncbi:YaaA family protein [Fusibacter sp. JL216-2]|uniref:YaaA family protein n=1 Tax=Fusibacter sp. JL216-2 TaxID=3071453 RepID=UPI003D34FA5E
MLRVLLSPSKEQSYKEEAVDDMKMLPFLKQTKTLVNHIQAFSKEDLGKIMNIKNDILDRVYETYQNFGHTGIRPAIQAYSGLAFRQIPVEAYSDDALNYLEDHVRILSALYGILTPLTGISAYRLDMKMKVIEDSLYAFWKNDLSHPFDDGDIVINLASKEFSRLVKMPMVTVEFKEYKNGKLKTIGTNAKKARGMMVHYMVENRIESVEALKGFNKEEWCYDDSLSSDKTMIFTRGNANA